MRTPLTTGFQIGVVEDDDRRLAAELEMGALDALGRGRQHFFAGRDIPVSEIMATRGWAISGAPTVLPRP